MPITMQQALQRTIEHREIFHDEMLDLMRQIMSGEVSPVMIAALTVGLRVKKETVGEIAAAAQVMREFATKVEVPDRENLLDIVGTGGDAAHTFNISTAAMFVAAAAGARVAKHGNRSVSSKSGSADVLEALGANIMLTAAQVARMHRRNRHRLHVRAQPSRGDEARGAGAQGAGRAHDLQHPRAAHQSGRRGQPADGRVPSRPGRDPGARAAAPRRQARAGGVRQGRHGRGVARRGDHGGRAQGRRGPRVRDPSGGLRPAHEVATAVSGSPARTSRRPCCSKRSTMSTARRAKSSCSTPARRSTPQGSPSRSPRASRRRANRSPRARRRKGWTRSSPRRRGSARCAVTCPDARRTHA